MRFTTAYYLLLIYSLVMLKSLMPVVSDVLSHAFAEAMHIATVHAKYGSHHLEKELENTARDNGKSRNATIAEENFTVHVSTNEYKFHFLLSILNKAYSSFRLVNLKTVFYPIQAPPPKFC